MMKYEFNKRIIILGMKNREEKNIMDILILSSGKINRNKNFKKIPTFTYTRENNYLSTLILFDKTFIENNGKILKLIINNKLNNLINKYVIPLELFCKDFKLKVKLKIISNILNMS